MEKFSLRAYTKDQIPDVWETYSQYIQRALDRGSNYTLDDIHKGLLLGEMQLWAWGDEAALVTAIQNREDKRWCLLLAIGGANMADWIQYLPIVEEWAKENGCDEMRLYGRMGWAKVIGYDVEWTKMSKQL